MLIEFTVGNFRSFRDMQQLSMIAAPSRNGELGMDEEPVFEAAGVRLLKSKAIFGANASGKSNITNAMACFHQMVVRSVSNEGIGKTIWEERFGLLTDWDDEPVFFQLLFVHENSIYRYGFQIKNGIVDAEWLFGRLNKQEVKFFTRGPGGIDIVETNFKGAKTYIDLSLNGEHEVFRPDSLFLTGTALMGNKTALAIRKTLGHLMLVDGLGDAMGNQLSMRWLDSGDDNQQAAIRKLMGAVDPSIKDIQLLDVPDEKFSSLSPELQDALRKTAGTNPKTVYTFRERYNSSGESTGLIPTTFSEWESEGTKKLFALSAPIFTALLHGRPFIIDEFDARFHPLITEKIVSLFHNKDTNPHNAQLIFVTHDASLLNRASLRRDQVFLVDKDRYGISSAKTLIQFKGVRKDASYEKEYLQGTYGAVPFLGELNHIITTLVTDGISDAE